MSDKQTANKRKTVDKANVPVEGVSGPLDNLDILDQKVAELRAALKAGRPLSMGKTNLLAGILQSLRASAASW